MSASWLFTCRVQNFSVISGSIGSNSRWLNCHSLDVLPSNLEGLLHDSNTTTFELWLKKLNKTFFRALFIETVFLTTNGRIRSIQCWFNHLHAKGYTVWLVCSILFFFHLEKSLSFRLHCSLKYLTMTCGRIMSIQRCLWNASHCLPRVAENAYFRFFFKPYVKSRKLLPLFSELYFSIRCQIGSILQ